MGEAEAKRRSRIKFDPQKTVWNIKIGQVKGNKHERNLVSKTPDVLQG